MRNASTNPKAITITLVKESHLKLSTITDIARPLDTDPKLYDITFNINEQLDVYKVEVKIDVLVKSNNCQYIILSKGKYDIYDILVKKGTEVMAIQNIYDYLPNEVLIIQTTQKLRSDTYTVFIYLRNFIRTEMENMGLCIIKPPKHENNSYFIITHLDQTTAKSIFPCFDRPQVRVPFVLSVSIPSKNAIKVVSNTRIERFVSDFPVEHYTTYYFLKTSAIQTQKVFVGLGNYSVTEPIVSKTGFVITLLCRNEVLEFTSEIPKLVSSIIDNMAKYFHKSVSTPSLDVILSPLKWNNMVCAGIPGIIIFYESILLSMRKKNCMEFLKTVMFLIHELAHLWIGGDAMIDDWADDWIVEGIVNVVTHECGQMVYPHWYTDWIPLMYQIHPLLSAKCYVNARFETQESIIEKMIGEESYQNFIRFRCKNLALFRMVWCFSPIGFRISLVNMLTKKERINYPDMWKEVVGELKELKVNINDFLKAWSQQEGYPIISVKTTHNNIQILTQSRSKQFGEISNKDIVVSWPIPIKYIDMTQPKIIMKMWFKSNASEAIISELQGRWFKLNWHQTGFYRVNYTYDQWVNFTDIFNKNSHVLDPEDRGNLLDDAFSLAAAGYFQYHIPFNLTSYLRHGEEKHYFPLATAFQFLNRIYYYFYGSDVQPLYEKFMHELLAKSLVQNLWEIDQLSVTETLRRVEILRTACWANHTETLEKVRALYTKWIYNLSDSKIHIELLNIVSRYGLAGTVDKKLWQDTFNAYRSSRDNKKKILFWRALSGVNDPGILNSLLHASMTRQVPLEGTLIKMAVVAENPLAGSLLWTNLKRLIPSLDEIDEPDVTRVMTCIKKFIYFIKDEHLLSEIFNYIKSKSAHSEVKDIEYCIKDNIQWVKRNHDFLKEWLHRYVVNTFT